MTFYEHISELRAELSANTSAKEIRQIRRELNAALTKLARGQAGFDTAIRSG
ncbi:hypothetical protein ACFO8O_11545 [Hephaestia sp. GCM10023244]|uniref:hypothetical protein n=1 Tax=unclassified Hephaestia TaxID=2631281 RepID=UPI002076F73B|nr:hypothetical protein [Hephaestia sp. MAHUQ-44]MCM8731592.1 hypothetical protein [Hephaestia sp. MAHUQ-44]